MRKKGKESIQKIKQQGVSTDEAIESYFSEYHPDLIVDADLFYRDMLYKMIKYDLQ